MNQPTENKTPSWKTRTYVIGTLLGGAMGLLSAYMFAREAEDEADDEEQSPELPPSVLLGLALSILSLVRQIAESGRKRKK